MASTYVLAYRPIFALLYQFNPVLVHLLSSLSEASVFAPVFHILCVHCPNLVPIEWMDSAYACTYALYCSVLSVMVNVKTPNNVVRTIP